MSASNFWTLDFGNSALKLREHDALDELPGELTIFANDAELLNNVRCKLEGQSLLGVAFSSVADEAYSAELEALLREHSPVFVSTTDALLANDSTAPETVGADRLFAALGALVMLPPEESCAIVCDAGTALTVDLVLRTDESDGLCGRFKGGAIAPGPKLLAKALSLGGARLFEVSELEARMKQTPALGRDTEAALRSGVVHGFRGIVKELALRIAEESGVADPAICMTGGARGLLAGVFPKERLIEEASLTGRGLLAALARELG